MQPHGQWEFKHWETGDDAVMESFACLTWVGEWRPLIMDLEAP